MGFKPRTEMPMRLRMVIEKMMTMRPEIAEVSNSWPAWSFLGSPPAVVIWKAA